MIQVKKRMDRLIYGNIKNTYQTKINNKICQVLYADIYTIVLHLANMLSGDRKKPLLEWTVFQKEFGKLGISATRSSNTYAHLVWLQINRSSLPEIKWYVQAEDSALALDPSSQEFGEEHLKAHPDGGKHITKFDR